MPVHFRCLLAALLLLTSTAQAECPAHIEAGFWAESSFRVLGADLAGVFCPNNWTSGRAGLSYFGDDDLFFYKGFTASGRVQFGNIVYPFAGLGLLAGVGEKDEDASADQQDNDQDGVVDEPGETKEHYRGHLFLYPEVGVEMVTSLGGISATVRKYYGDHFVGNTVFVVGINIPMDW